MLALLLLLLSIGGEAFASGGDAPPPPPAARLDLAQGLDRANRPGPGYHLGQGAGIAFAAAGVVSQGAGWYILLGGGDVASNYAGGTLVTLGGISSAVGAGCALGAATALRNEGTPVPTWAGWSAVALTGVAVSSVPLGVVTGQPGLMYVGLFATPVVAGLGITQLAIQHGAVRRSVRARVGVAPVRGGGAMTMLMVRFP